MIKSDTGQKVCLPSEAALQGMKIVLDVAHGAAFSRVAKTLCEPRTDEVILIGVIPLEYSRKGVISNL